MKVPKEYEGHIQISNSRREQIAACPRKYYWSYQRQLTSKYTSMAMFYGSMWHLLLHKYYSHVKQYGREGLDPLKRGAIKSAMQNVIEEWDKAVEDEAINPGDDYRNLENLARSFTLYLDKFSTYEQDYSMDIIASEREFCLELEPSDYELKCYPEIKDLNVVITGIIDLVPSQHGYVWIYEHKSTGSYLGQIADKLYRSAQTIGYLWAAQQIFPDINITGVIANIHHISARKNKAGVYGEPKIEFLREPLTYTQGDIQQWRLSVIEQVVNMEAQKKRGVYPMNLDRCYDFFSHCVYEDLCQQNKINLEETYIDEDKYTLRKDK